jgi:hypothetical protein
MSACWTLSCRTFEESISMKNLSVLCIAIGISLMATAASARGGMGSHPSFSLGIPVTGGASGERVTAPGTNSLGTALSSDSFGAHPQKGPLLGTGSAVDREEARVDRALNSVCRGC